MAEIIKTFKENVPAMRFIGKKYPDCGANDLQTAGSTKSNRQWAVRIRS